MTTTTKTIIQELPTNPINDNKPTTRKCFVCSAPLSETPKAKINHKSPPCKSATLSLYTLKTRKDLRKEDRIKHPQDDAKNRKALPNEEITATNEVFRILK